MARPRRFGTSRLGFWLTAGLIAACGSKVIDSKSNDSDAGGGRGGKAAGGSSGSAGIPGASAGTGVVGTTGGAGSAASDSGAGTSGRGGSAGALGSNGSGGAEAGARIDSPRRCGPGLPCTEGATCGTHWVEWGSSCECDPSGHFFCDSYVGGGAGGEMNCIGCGSGAQGGSTPGNGGSGGTAGRTCQQTNGYCTMTCSCASNDCTFDCSGSGPAPSEGTLCDPRFCDTPGAAVGGCSVKDGACDYAIECTPGGRPEITGSCE